VSLLYNVSTLLRESIGSAREYDVDDRVLVDDEEPRAEHVAGQAAFLRTMDGVLVTAHLRGKQHELCSRCLREIDVPLQMDFEEEFFVTVDGHTGVALARPEDPEAFLIDSHQQLDLEEAVRQAWTSVLPMKALCRADCRGLCPTCGNDLNDGACPCAAPEDDRWSALRRLLVETQGK